MDDNLKKKIAHSLVDRTKIELYYDGVGFVVFNVEYPFNRSKKMCQLKINLGDKESWTFDMPPYGQLYDYLESLFRVKDRDTLDEIREMIIDAMEDKVRKLRKYLLTP
jgi:hypothetical protein